MRKIVYLVAIMSIFMACGETPAIDNPYDSQVPENGDHEVGTDTIDLDPLTIQGLHNNIFKPTCANSGCHDGNFEPDFRTVESSYNSLVNQPIIKNDEMDPLTARVIPGNSDRSMIIRRLMIDLNMNSGVMPLALEPNSDWVDKKDEYIQNIRDWIDAGATDINGDKRDTIDFPPQLEGMIAVSGGNTIQRFGRYNPILVDKALGSVDIWFAYSDAESDFSAFSNLEWNHSIHFQEFDSLAWQPMQYVAAPRQGTSLNLGDVDHHFKFTLSLANYQVDDVIWLRTRISDGTNDVELPNNNSLFNAIKYCTIKLK